MSVRSHFMSNTGAKDNFGIMSSFMTRVYTSRSRHVLNNQTPWLESAMELYRLSDRRLSAKLVPTFADRVCRVVSTTDPYDRILGFLDNVDMC
jgi:hypothetical protein